MCRHCANLVEDKETVHSFMALAAKRLSGKLGRLVDPDEVIVDISVNEAARKPNYATMGKAIKALNEIHR